MVILKLVKNQEGEEFIFELMSRHIISMQHLLSFYKNCDESGYYNYIKYLKFYEEGCYGSINQAYSNNSVQERVKFLEYAYKFMEGLEKNADFFTKTMLGEQIERLKDILRSGVKNPTEETVTQQVLVFLESDAWKEAISLAKTNKIPDRRFTLLKCRALIKINKYSDLDRLLKEKNKKPPHLIPYDVIVQLLLEENALDLAEMYAERIPEIETQVQVFRNMGKVQKAAEIAYKKGMVDLVDEIRITSNSPEISNFIEKLISSGPPGK